VFTGPGNDDFFVIIDDITDNRVVNLPPRLPPPPRRPNNKPKNNKNNKKERKHTERNTHKTHTTTQAENQPNNNSTTQTHKHTQTNTRTLGRTPAKDTEDTDTQIHRQSSNEHTHTERDTNTHQSQRHKHRYRTAAPNNTTHKTLKQPEDHTNQHFAQKPKTDKYPDGRHSWRGYTDGRACQGGVQGLCSFWGCGCSVVWAGSPRCPGLPVVGGWFFLLRPGRGLFFWHRLSVGVV
jgi:hypothetical protein